MTPLETMIDKLLTSKLLPYPDSVYIDSVGNLCQLKCPLCPVGAKLLTQDRIIMSMETFTTILDKMPFLRAIELYRSGEPFLNPEIFAMIRLAHQRNIKVVISTHFSFVKPDVFFEELAASGLDTLVVSLDGTSQETYSQYRVGGDYDLVMSNIKKLIEAKNRARRNKPEIIWQFLVNKYNEHEIATAQGIAISMGMPLDLRPISLADNEPDVRHECIDIEERKLNWLPQNEAYISDCYKGTYRYPLSKGICPQLFTRVMVMADGKILPCCEVWDQESAFGDLLKESFDDIWYGRKYLDARSRALNKKHSSQIQSVCFRCNNFGTTPSIIDKLRLLQLVFRKGLRHWWQKTSLMS
ncbi:MAG: radical SAM protein [Desulfobulbaceae bacterium]|nr:radical SAM protein [Desulfobulbaceae bacterium]